MVRLYSSWKRIHFWSAKQRKATQNKKLLKKTIWSSVRTTFSYYTGWIAAIWTTLVADCGEALCRFGTSWIGKRAKFRLEQGSKTPSWNFPKWGTYRSLTEHGEFDGFSDLWQQIWLTNVCFLLWKLIIFGELCHPWLENSPFLNLINQSAECYSEEPWLSEWGTFITSPGSYQPWSWICRLWHRNWLICRTSVNPFIRHGTKKLLRCHAAWESILTATVCMAHVEICISVLDIVVCDRWVVSLVESLVADKPVRHHVRSPLDNWKNKCGHIRTIG